MDVKQSFMLALKSIMANKMRALLTMLRDYYWRCRCYFDCWTWQWRHQ